MKAVVISIKPQRCEMIFNGEKTLELRKNKPNIDAPFRCYVYCTKTEPLDYHCYGQVIKMSGKVIGEFICDRIMSLREPEHGLVDVIDERRSCVPCRDIIKYANGKAIYGWHITNAVLYDEPKNITEFKKHYRKCFYSDLGLAIPKCENCNECNLKRAPQSWCYVEELENNNE